MTAGCYSLEVSAALSHQLPDCGLPSGMTMTLMVLPGFLARQLAAHPIGLRCSTTAVRSVLSLVNESSAPPSNVFHDNAVLALPRSLPS